MLRTRQLNRHTTRRALLFGFSAILAVLLAAGLYAVRVLDEAQLVTERRNREVYYTGQILDNLQFAFLSASTNLRDYLLEPDPSLAEETLQSLLKVLQRGREVSAQYDRLAVANDREDAQALHVRVEEFWKLIDPVLTWNHARRQREGFNYLKRFAYPKRAEVLALTVKLTRRNEQHLQAAEHEFLSTFRIFRTRLNAMLFVAVLLGVLLGLGTSVYILHLERNLEAQYNEISKARQELEELSAGIVEAQEEERRSLARELHDEVGQSLSAILMDTGRAVSEVPEQKQDLRQTLSGIRASAETLLHKVRDLSLLLRPSMLDDFGLVAALHWQGREFFRRYGIHVNVSAEGVSEDLPDTIKTGVYRIVQEALANVARHSGATEVKILLRHQATRLLVAIQDNGHGFEPRLVRGLGLLGMEERTRRLNGRFRVESAPGKGTVLQIEIPTELDREENRRAVEISS